MNRYQSNRCSRHFMDKAVSALLWCLAAGVIAILLGILAYLFVRGKDVISWSFITQPPRDGMTAGGISTPILGTLQLILVSMVIAFPVGVMTAVYLCEFASENGISTLIRLAVKSLAGVPSVVFGLFGFTFFCIFLKFGVSLLSAGLTLACLVLPLIVAASEAAIKAVPSDYRDASYALGATQWQTVYKVVLPSAMPAILTGAILGVGRTAGETAPIIFTGAAFFAPQVAKSLFQQVMALPYHILVLATAGTQIDKTRPIQYGSALVLLVLVFGVSFVGVVLRARARRRRMG